MTLSLAGGPETAHPAANRIRAVRNTAIRLVGILLETAITGPVLVVTLLFDGSQGAVGVYMAAA